jgi:hypothetical protein
MQICEQYALELGDTEMVPLILKVTLSLTNCVLYWEALTFLEKNNCRI